MMINFDGYILLRGLVIGDTIQITQYNGLPTHVFKKLLSKLGNESIFTNKTVSIGMDKATFRQEVEILANVKYKKHHSEIYDISIVFYKLRSPKCVFGFKSTFFYLRRVSEDCFRIV